MIRESNEQKRTLVFYVYCIQVLKYYGWYKSKVSNYKTTITLHHLFIEFFANDTID